MMEELCEYCRAFCDKKQIPESRFCFLDFESLYSLVLLDSEEDLYAEFEQNVREWKQWLRLNAAQCTGS